MYSVVNDKVQCTKITTVHSRNTIIATTYSHTIPRWCSGNVFWPILYVPPKKIITLEDFCFTLCIAFLVFPSKHLLLGGGKQIETGLTQVVYTF